MRGMMGLLSRFFAKQQQTSGAPAHDGDGAKNG
jgi:hypothetical protein